MTAPLVLLAIPSVVIGFLTIGPMLYGDFFKDSIVVDADQAPGDEGTRPSTSTAPTAMALHGLITLPFWLALAGVVAGLVLLPEAARRSRRRSSARFGFVYRLLDNKYYMDWFNEHVLAARRAAARARACGRAATSALIDGVVINGSARAVGGIAGVDARCCRPATSTGTRW